MDSLQLYVPEVLDEEDMEKYASPYRPQTMEQALKYVLENKEGMRLKGQPRMSPHELEEYLRQQNVFHLPQYIYQIMFDTALCNIAANTPENGKMWIKEQLMQHLKDNHPGYELQGFIDLRADEAHYIHPNMGWGMWYKLIRSKTWYEIQEEKARKEPSWEPYIDHMTRKRLLGE